MKTKRLSFLVAISAFSMSLGGCSLQDVMFWKKPEENEQRDAVLQSIQTHDEQVIYNYKENFVKPGVTALYDDNSTKEVKDQCVFKGFNSSVAGEQEINVTYTEGQITKSTSYKVVINAGAIDALRIEIGQNTKKEYQQGDTFENPIVTAYYSDESSADVSNNVQCSGYNLNVPGKQTVNVSYTYKYGNTVTSSYEINVIERRTNLKFAIFADVQLCNDVVVKDGSNVVATTNVGNTANAPIALKNHLSFIKEQGITTVLMNGDVCNQANEYYYGYFDRILKEVYGTDESTYPEFLWNMGNHEWWYGTSEKETGDAVSMFESYARIDSANLKARSQVKYSINENVNVPSYYKEINGIPFIVISAESSRGDVGTGLEAEIKGWLAQAKALKSVKAGGPIFVEYHYPLHTSMTHGEGASETASTVETIFADTPNAVIFTGDTHYPGVNERAINQVDFTTINLGSSSYSRMVDKSAVITEDYDNVYGASAGKNGDIPHDNIAFKQAYTPTLQIVDVSTDNTTKIDRYFTEDGGKASHVGTTWKLDTINSKDDFVYTNDRFQNKASAQALYGKDGLVWENTDIVEFGINPESQRATVLFKDVTDFHSVEHYEIKINDKKYDVASNYYTNPEERTDNYYILDNVPASDSYVVTVTAYDFFDNPSTNTLSSTNNNVSLAVDEIDRKISLYPYPDISRRLNVQEKASNESHSSNEFYYKGIQPYNYGATVLRVIDKEKQNAEYDVADMFSFNDLSEDQPIFKFKAKVTTNDDLNVGITVVNSAGTWKTDFGAEYQQTITPNDGWKEFTFNLKTLFNISKKSELNLLQIKIKSNAATTDGYEMGILVDDVDIYNGSGTIPPVERGEAFTAGEDYSVNMEKVSSVVVDIKFKSDASTHLNLGLIDCVPEGDWDNYFGYYEISSSSKTGDFDGIKIDQTDDGYMRLTIDATKLSKKNGNPSLIGCVYIRGNWTTANGLIDVNPTQGEIIIPNRGEEFSAGQHYTKDIPSQELSEPVIIDIKFTTGNDTHVNVMLGDGWDDYFGYFEITKLSKTGDYNGMTVQSLTDGYTRFIFDLSQATKKTGNPEGCNLIYFRDVWTTASGYVDINPTAEVEVIRGKALTFDETKDTNYDDALSKQYDIANDSIEIDIKFDTNENTKVNVALLDNWTNYFGYYALRATSKTGDHVGMTVTQLNDGYLKFTFKLSELTKVNNQNNGTPAPEYVGRIYLRGTWSVGSIYYDLITK